MKKSDSIEMVTTSADHATSTKETKIDARLTSFLEKDDSFLTPWSWVPKSSKNEINSTKEKEYLSFHPHSYFTYEIIDQKYQTDNAEANFTQCWPSARSCSEAWNRETPMNFHPELQTCSRSKVGAISRNKKKISARRNIIATRTSNPPRPPPVKTPLLGETEDISFQCTKSTELLKKGTLSLMPPCCVFHLLTSLRRLLAELPLTNLPDPENIAKENT